MNIMWVISQLLPMAAESLGLKPSNFGGWVKSMLNYLEQENNIHLTVVMCSGNTKSIVHYVENEVNYYILPTVGSNKKVNQKDIDSVIGSCNPELIHIEGTEWTICEQFSSITKCKKIVSLQGIINGYEPYQYGDLPIADFMFSTSFTKVITGWTLFFRKRILFNKRLKTEKKTIENADYIMGRTLWDRSHSYFYNSKAKYYSCNRILRKSFYKNEWDYNTCTKHLIFVGNGYSALKGGHTVLEAVCLLVNEFPDIKVVFGGADPYVHSKKDLKKRIGYSFYLRQMLKRKELANRVEYLGEQNEQQMVQNLLNSNVYILPSIIENSPNTLGEAMIMGVPCISAYTGGASQMAIDEKEVLFFRAADSVMLAYQIKRIFNMQQNVETMCKAAQVHAQITHDPKANVEALLYAYNDIIRGS